MKSSNLFDNLISKYNLAKNTYENVPVATLEEYGEWLAYFCNKWQHKFVAGYWHVDLALHPVIWYKAIDEALDIINSLDPAFRICTIKTKFGGLRIHLHFTDEEDVIFSAIEELEDVLYDDSFVY